MAAFPSHHHPFLLDPSLFFPNAIATAAGSFPDQFHQPHGQEVMPSGSLEYTTKLTAHSNQAAVANKLQSSDSSISMVVDDHKVESSKRKLGTNKSSINYAQSNGITKENSKRWRKQKKSQENKKKKKDSEEGQIGYFYVRARRGQATDSHSLAERVRREKISERMKILQAIVPGCDKVTGKVVMLDEIINYVQFLQNEIEFLSMKLACVNPMLHEFGADLDAFMVKPDQNMSSMQQWSADNQQEQLLSFQQQEQMPNMLPQNNGEQLWDLEEQIQELDDPFAIINNFNSFY